jgi:translocation and assembly module TamA
MSFRSGVTLIGLFLLLCGSAAAEPPRLDIEITGVSGDLLGNVQANLSLYQQREHPLLNDALIQRLHKQAPDEIRHALEPFGYYRARSDSSLVRTETGWRAQYAIETGEPIRLAAVSIALEGAGATDIALQHWRAVFPLHEGDIPLHETYENAKQALLRLARERGYIEGKLLENRLTIDLDRYQASIVLSYATGPRYAFGEISFSQQGFDEAFLRRYLRFKPGDPYDGAKLLELRRALADSDYFEGAEIVSQFDQVADRRIPIRIDLTLRKPARYSAGLGYATDTGVRGMLGFEKRRANESGDRYSVTLRESQILSSVTARYQIPLRRPATDSLSYNVSWIDEDTDTLESIKTSTGVDLTQQTGPWLRTIGLSYELERYRLGNADDSTLLIPHIRWQRASTEDRIQVRDGWLFGVEFRGAHDAVLSDTSFFQTRSEGKYIHSLGEHARLLLRGAAGGSVTPEFIDLPASQRFLAGGDQSIRGYDYETLGPTDADGNVIGGRDLLVGSIELEHDVYNNVALAAFFDAGNAFNPGEFAIRRGRGVGLRLHTPIGALRIDAAEAMDKSDRPWRLHLTVGPDL